MDPLIDFESDYKELYYDIYRELPTLLVQFPEINELLKDRKEKLLSATSQYLKDISPIRKIAWNKRATALELYNQANDEEKMLINQVSQSINHEITSIHAQFIANIQPYRNKLNDSHTLL